MYYSGNQFWDDGLAENEMDLICGVYKLYSKYRIFITAYFFADLGPTVHKEQFAGASWWLKQSTFMVLGLNVGYWSPDCKAWFQSCTRTILDGTATIKNASVWCQVMKFEKPMVLKLVQNQKTIASHLQQNTEPKSLQDTLASSTPDSHQWSSVKH